MELLDSENYSTGDRDFEIHTYRDNSSESLVIEPSEIVSGKRVPLQDLKSKLSINNQSLTLKAPEYEGYENALAKVKRSLVALVAIDKM